MPKADCVHSTPPETYEPFATPDAFCDALARIGRIGSCRRLVFVVSDPGAP
jgi:hypothetical protein